MIFVSVSCDGERWEVAELIKPITGNPLHWRMCSVMTPSWRGVLHGVWWEAMSQKATERASVIPDMQDLRRAVVQPVWRKAGSLVAHVHNQHPSLC